MRVTPDWTRQSGNRPTRADRRWVGVTRCLAKHGTWNHSETRGEPPMVAQLLRAAIVVRVADSELADSAEPLLDELLAHTRRHGLVVLQADAHALRGRRQLLVGAEDKALSDVAVALAMLDEEI